MQLVNVENVAFQNLSNVLLECRGYEGERSGTVGKQQRECDRDAIVLNCANEIETKSEIIKIVVHAAKESLGIFDVKGDEIQGILEKGFGGTQKLGK